MVLFDLDGTLLPMDLDRFVRSYFKKLADKLAPLGYEPQMLMKAVGTGIGAMSGNDGRKTNQEAFWEAFVNIYGEKAKADVPVFDAFYKNEFNEVQKDCGFNPESAQIVRGLKERGVRVVLATNPLFPAAATQNRIRWAGLVPEDFEFITTYENSSFCKPNLAYYEEILRKVGVSAQECVMVGNDVTEDMAAGKLGMQVFLLTDCLINKGMEDISAYPHGGFEELGAFLEMLLTD